MMADAAYACRPRKPHNVENKCLVNNAATAFDESK
jgi:hypothetical protein